MTSSPSWRRLATVVVAAAVTVTTTATATSAAPTAPDDPIFDTDAHPAFDWSMPERYDASWAAYRFSSGTYRPAFVTPSSWSIRLDACDSTAVRRITGYVFTISRVGTAWTRTFTSRTCATRYDALPALGAYDVRLSLTTDWAPSVGVSGQVRKGATLKDFLIVSMGDSLASGEGNPDVRGDYDPVGPDRLARWKDKRCHRSALSGPALAARAIEKADPHSSVSFISVACSGARIPHVSHWTYEGIVGERGFRFPSQVKQVANLVGPESSRGGRRISAILLSAGVNDLYFSGVIRRCAKLWTGDGCVRWGDRTNNLAGLPASYHRLAREISTQLPDTARVLVNNYPAHVFKNGACGVLRGITQSKGQEIASVGELLNRAVTTAIRRHVGAPYRWKAVPDLDAPFTPHPYCGSSTWFTRLEWSLRRQGDVNGTAHPNGPGHRAYAGILRGALQSVI
jgi:RES domain-containing protein